MAQQTAANLHVVPGDVVTIARAGLAPVEVTVDGVVDLPQANSLFQKVGAPTGAQPQAPPDNVLLLPSVEWHQLFDPLAQSRPDLVQAQVHVKVSHRLPGDPAAAYNRVSGAARNLEARLAGAGIVGDNLGATLAGGARRRPVRASAVPLPGCAGRGARGNADGRGREQWRGATPTRSGAAPTRGATTRQLVRLGLVEA